MGLNDKIINIIETSLSQEGYEIVQVNYFEQRKRNTLQIMIDRIDGAAVVVSDCEKVSRICSVLLDSEDPIKDRYDLEVSSAGIDRPLVRLKDFATYAGFEAKIKTKLPVFKRKNFKCTIQEVKDNIVIVEQEINDKEVGIYEIEFENIQSAQLVLTDKLIKFHKKLYDKKRG